ncbi:MAG: DUF2975 domain-containing protein [Prevotellaceae bacterium]|jgi:hypothetical protein|nr:DUF2975 domain-containing protein [Prevotellaceae bacterium]
MNGKLKIYCLCFIIIYAVFFAHIVYDEGKLAIAGFEFGYAQSATGNGNVHVCGSYVEPVDGSVTFPSVIVNEKTGEEVHFEMRQILAFLSDFPENIPAYVKIMDGATIILSLIMVALFIYIPFIGYRIVKSVAQNVFYSIKNIRRIRKIALILLMIFLITVFINLSTTISTNAYLQITGYRAYVGTFDYSSLFTGLIMLILSEILRYTANIKEEQDLTV